MSKLLIYNTLLKGRVTAPPSKSQAVRAAILYSLCGKSPYKLFAYCASNPADDIANALRACNTAFFGSGIPDVGESAALFRMLIPVLLARYGIVDMTVNHRTIERGIDEYTQCMGVRPHIESMGDKRRIVIEKKLKPGNYGISCKRSSQFLSGLLMALPLLDGESRISIIDEKASVPYSDMTCAMVQSFGASVEKTEEGYVINHSSYSVPHGFSIEGDWSYAANYAVANRLGSSVDIDGVSSNSLQADKAIQHLIDSIYRNESVSVTQCPDLFCPIVIAACGKTGKTVIKGTARLCDKESNRPLAMERLVRGLGGKIAVEADCVCIYGTGDLYGGDCDSSADHRVVMAAAIAATICKHPVTLNGWECVKKSAPGFFNDYERLGGVIVK